MTEAKHTEGPWLSFAVDDVEVANGSVVLSMGDDESTRICIIDKENSGDVGTQRANQRLILAAPDMLEALQMQEDQSLLMKALKEPHPETKWAGKIFDKWLGEDTYKAPEVRMGEFIALRKQKRRAAIAKATNA